jgi:hypothetical protein
MLTGAEREIMAAMEITAGELDGVSAEVAFCLGVEWGMLSHRLQFPTAFMFTFSPRNEARFMHLLRMQGRKGHAEVDASADYPRLTLFVEASPWLAAAMEIMEP